MSDNDVRDAKRQEEIALKNSFLINVSYIECLIKSEEMSNLPHKKNRLEQSQDIPMKAKILEDAKNNPESLTGHVSQYETTVLTALYNIEDELTYDAQSYVRWPSMPSIRSKPHDMKTPTKKDKKSYIQRAKDFIPKPWK